MPILLKTISSLHKCFMDESIDSKPEMPEAACLRGEEFHFQIACTTTEPGHDPKATLYLDWDSDLPCTVETVEQIPVRVPCYHNPANQDDNYLRKTPGLYPDLLVPIKKGARVFVPDKELQALYVTVKVPENAPAGHHTITIRFTDKAFGNTVVSASLNLRVIAAALPKQELKVTNWLYCDCVSSYYGLEVFSDKHWEYLENLIRTAVENGINTILTPLFTVPLDTDIGYERPTLQLVDIEKTESGWKFSWNRLERWVEMCNRCGVEYFEICHLFTQWGLAHAPKVVAKVNGREQQVFGWETDGLGEEYIAFLRAFLKAFLAKMKSLGGADRRCLFHISDEPALAHLERYKGAVDALSDLLEDYPLMDALSNFDFYQHGLVKQPVPASNHIEPFLEAKVPNLWTYYCCGQNVDVSNRYLAMPSARTHIIGLQLWKYNLTGFLQWGYNSWFSLGSREVINPYLVNDGNYYVPAGDCYGVYPGPKGQPYNSLHMKAFTEALHDLRALKLAESLCGREAVLTAVEEGIGPVTFANYPHADDYIHFYRSKVHKLIEDALSQ